MAKGTIYRNSDNEQEEKVGVVFSLFCCAFSGFAILRRDLQRIVLYCALPYRATLNYTVRVIFY